MRDRILSVVQRIKEKNRIPCLSSVSEPDRGDHVDFQSLTIDMSSAEMGSEPSLSGVVDQDAHHKGVRVKAFIPGVYNVKQASVQEGFHVFADAILAAGASQAKPILVDGDMWIASDLWIPQGSDNSVEERFVWSVIRNVIEFAQYWSLHSWQQQAVSVMGEEAAQTGFQERMEAIEHSVGEPPFGEEVGGTV